MAEKVNIEINIMPPDTFFMSTPPPPEKEEPSDRDEFLRIRPFLQYTLLPDPIYIKTELYPC